MELNCALKLRWKKGQAVGGNYVSVGGHQGGKTAKNGIAAAASSVSGSGTSGGVNHSHAQYVLANENTGGPHNSRKDYQYDFNGMHAYYQCETGGASGFNHTHGLSATAAAQSITGDNETRPTNRGVRYIIKM